MAARILPKFVVFLAIFTFSTVEAVVPKSQRSYRTMSQGSQMSHLHFYFHDTVSGRNRTAIKVAEVPSTNNSLTAFGTVFIMDDPLTELPEATSKLVGRAQGIYASASQSDLGLLMTLNYVFMEGKYNGSTLSILGRNAVLSEVREMPVVGGTGFFRFARGFAQAKTHWLNPKTGDAVVEYMFMFPINIHP